MPAPRYISIRETDFDTGYEIEQLGQTAGAAAGAVASFVGLVRDQNEGQAVQGLHLQHYPAMTEKVLSDLLDQAEQRWHILASRIIHRIGDLNLTDRIVFVGVASAHRKDAFEACEFLMDFLKTQAPFWKKERRSDGSRWLDARRQDDQAAERWK